MLKSVSSICVANHLREDPCGGCPVSQRVLSGYTAISSASPIGKDTKCALDEAFLFCPYVGQKLPVWRKMDHLYLEVDDDKTYI